MAEPGERERERENIEDIYERLGQVFHNVKVPALSLVQKLRRGGEVKSESQIDIYEDEELIKGNRYHLDGGDSLGPGYEQFEAIRPQAY